MSGYMCFDVESVGLHGEGFWVGWVMLNDQGEEISHGDFACDPESASGAGNVQQETQDRVWLGSNVVPNLPPADEWFSGPRAVRDAFWRVYRDSGAQLIADVCWPVEANFLSECVADDVVGRAWEGPYPLLDVVSMWQGTGTAWDYDDAREPDELPIHHPVADARHAARALRDLLVVTANPARQGADQKQEASFGAIEQREEEKP